MPTANFTLNRKTERVKCQPFVTLLFVYCYNGVCIGPTTVLAYFAVALRES